MARKEIVNGELCVYCEEDSTWYPKYKDINGVRMELDEKYFIYVLEGDSVDESRERDELGREEDEYTLSMRYGLERKKFLKKYNSKLYFSMTSAELQHQLIELDKMCLEIEDKLINEYMVAEDVTEELKRKAPAEWVGRYNNIKIRVRELIQNDFIYTE